MVSNLPKWLQHANGNAPNPTPAEVEKDFQRESKAAQDAINGKPDSRETRDMHAALMADYGSMTLDGKPTGGRIDWETLHRAIPWIAVGLGGLMWLFFLVIPTVTGAHYAGMFPAISNYAYVAMGLTLLMAVYVAAKAQHGLRAIAFTFSLLLLSYWF